MSAKAIREERPLVTAEAALLEAMRLMRLGRPSRSALAVYHLLDGALVAVRREALT